MVDEHISNDELAGVLEKIAELLEVQDANPFRVRAYRRGAEAVAEADVSVAERLRRDGEEALVQMDDIGEGLAATIGEYVRTGRSGLLNRLQGEVSPETLFTRVPGIGQELAARVAGELGVNTLEELEQAAHDGRLAQVEGFGEKRVRSVQVSLAGMLSRAARRRTQAGGEAPARPEPPVDLLLGIDADYRRKAEAGTLKKIAPKRFNPDNEAWLPIMHADRDGWSFTALFSNTARAHELEKTDDWVVIYYERDGREGQCTVVTETRGPLEGQRVVRGREEACREYYASRK